MINRLTSNLLKDKLHAALKALPFSALERNEDVFDFERI